MSKQSFIYKILMLIILVFALFWNTAPVFCATDSLGSWLLQEQDEATTFLLDNVSPPDAAPGFIAASPSRQHPHYYYHWVRDSGIAVRAIIALYETTTDPMIRQQYLDDLTNFIAFTKLIQKNATQGGIGLGEPVFTVDGWPVPHRGAKPQDDGPAIRAIELTHLASLLLDEGRDAFVRKELYDSRLPTDSIIKADLEYVSHHWRETSYDPWEENRGHHFYTQVLQRKALTAGSILAKRLGDAGAAAWYSAQAAEIGTLLGRYWDPARGYIVATLDHDAGIDYKKSNLDSAVIVAALGGYAFDDLNSETLFPIENERMLATVAVLEKTFEALYPINARAFGIPGIAIGRYPEDRYDGYATDSIGNPWPSLTIAFAMYYHELAIRLGATGKIVVTKTSLPFFKKLTSARSLAFRSGDVLTRGDGRFEQTLADIHAKGDSFLARVRCHSNPDGSLSEQMNRVTGFQQGADNLSMNYAALILTSMLHSQLVLHSQSD